LQHITGKLEVKASTSAILSETCGRRICQKYVSTFIFDVWKKGNVGLANKLGRAKDESAKEESRVISPLSPPPVSLLQGRWEGMFCSFPIVGLVFIKMSLEAINGPSGVCIYKNATKGYKWPSNIILRTSRLCNSALNTTMGSLTYNVPSAVVPQLFGFGRKYKTQ
jgi:hypothetical protein